MSFLIYWSLQEANLIKETEKEINKELGLEISSEISKTSSQQLRSIEEMKYEDYVPK